MTDCLLNERVFIILHCNIAIAATAVYTTIIMNRLIIKIQMTFSKFEQ